MPTGLGPDLKSVDLDVSGCPPVQPRRPEPMVLRQPVCQLKQHQRQPHRMLMTRHRRAFPRMVGEISRVTNKPGASGTRAARLGENACWLLSYRRENLTVVVRIDPHRNRGVAFCGSERFMNSDVRRSCPRQRGICVPLS
jgi:hypothetical protein